MVGITAITATTATMIYESIGTGVIYSATASYAYIVTNNHVIERDNGQPAKRIRVTLPSGSTVTATLVGRDTTTDIAVLRVKARKLTPAVFRTDLSQLAHGDFVVAIGNAKVLKHPVTSGNVTAILKNIDYPGLSGVHEVIESSAPLDHGNSGGPLADVDARVVGINMAELLSGRGRHLPARRSGGGGSEAAHGRGQVAAGATAHARLLGALAEAWPRATRSWQMRTPSMASVLHESAPAYWHTRPSMIAPPSTIGRAVAQLLLLAPQEAHRGLHALEGGHDQARKTDHVGSRAPDLARNLSGDTSTPRSITLKSKPRSDVANMFLPMSWMSPATVPSTIGPGRRPRLGLLLRAAAPGRAPP